MCICFSFLVRVSLLPMSLLPDLNGRPLYASSRIDIMCSEAVAVEERSQHLLDQLLRGEVTVADLMGPLSGRRGLTPTAHYSLLPEGDKSRRPTAEDSPFLPDDDESNKLLQSHVHPVDYVNPIPSLGEDEYDLVVIGAGVSGLISVIIGAWLGKKCALIERHGMGGDCLNTGCVPSKALISCARAAHSVKNLSQFGVIIPEGSVTIDFGHIMRRMREIRAKISHHDSVQRYSREFCKNVFIGQASFLSNSPAVSAATSGDNINVVEIIGDDGSSRRIRYKKAMIASGASATIPPIPGLKYVPHLTNSNFFNLTERPESMIVIGCGPIGLELAQCMARFGSEVTCLERGPHLLSREDPDAAAILQEQLIEDGVIIHLNVKFLNISFDPTRKLYDVVVDINGEVKTLHSAALLNATGRTPNVHDMGLELVNVEYDNLRGVMIDDMFRTTNPNIYACGDCCTPYKFTHSADFQARMAVRNMFLGDHNRLSSLLIPWCTYTEPEIAHVGKYENELKASGIEYECFSRQLKDVDRCLCDGVTKGFVKIIAKSGTDEILGATICGPNAGDMISELTLSIQHGIGITQIAGTIHPYPTAQESIRQACLGYNKYFKNPKGVPLTTLKLLMKKIDDDGDGGEK